MTIKQQLIPLRIGKGLLSLVALFVMLLAPQRAWAQTDYGLTVAGVAVTSENAAAITGENITSSAGSVSYNNSTKTLTLNNARFEGTVNWTNSSNLTIEILGDDNEIDAKHQPTFVGNNSNAELTLTTGTTAGSLLITSIYTSEILSGWKNNSSIIYYDETTSSGDASNYSWWADGYSEQWRLRVNKKYDLWVDNVRLCSVQKEVKFGQYDYTEVISFDGDHTLTINNVGITRESENPFIKNGLAELDIYLKGTNTITASSLFLDKYGNGETPNVVTFKTELGSDVGSLTFTSSGIQGGIWCKDHTIAKNDGLTIKESNSGSDFTATVSVPNDLNITVDGTPVTPTNANNILSDDNDNKVSFDPNTNTLYLDGATISGNIETSLDKLTISVSDANTLTGSVRYTGTNSSSATLTIDANLEYANSASLTLSTESQEIGVISGFNTVSVNAPLETTVTDWTNTVKSATITAECYDIRVAGVLITKGNKENVLGTPEGTAPTVSFTPAEGNDPATLTLNNATIDLTKYESSGIIYKGSSDFTIKLIGTNSIKVQYNCEPIIFDVYQPTTVPSLTFERGSHPCSLELQGVNSSVIKSFGDVLGVNGINDVTDKLLKLDTDAVVAYTQENGLHTVQDNETTPVTSAKIVSVLKDPEFCFYVDETISNGETKEYEYGLEQTLPVLKRQDNGSLIDPTGFNVTYTSSDANVATIDNTGKITIVGGGWTEIRASIEATGDYSADEAWFTMEVIPAVPQVFIDQVSIEDEEGGAYFTGQKLTLKRVGESGSMYYSFGYEEDESNRTRYVGEISLSAGEYLFYPYTRCGTDENSIWSVNWPTKLYVYDEPTISKDADEYEGDIEVVITNLPQPQSNNISVKVKYYLGDDDDDEENDKLYTAGDKITVRESTKLNVYLVVEGDSSKYKTKVIERQYVIKDIPLDVTANDFHNHWMTYYHNKNGNVGLPENQNIGAYVATSISGNEIVVTQIKSIPRGEPVLLNNETTTTTTNVFGQDVQDNLLKHATEDVQLDEECDYYGLYNGAFERVKTIPAGKNYLMVSNAVVPGGHAPKLTIVFDNEATGVNDVRSKMEDVRGDIYDLQGRKVQKPSKKGLYINKGHKVVVK